jgi:1,4-alpha-glucan branching enzyme
MEMKPKRKQTNTADRSIEFRLELSNAQEVCLIGDFNRWDLKAHPMRKNETGVWTKTISVSPGRYEYRFYADGQWLNDPSNPLRCENCFGTENSVLLVLP